MILLSVYWIIFLVTLFKTGFFPLFSPYHIFYSTGTLLTYSGDPEYLIRDDKRGYYLLTRIFIVEEQKLSNEPINIPSEYLLLAEQELRVRYSGDIDPWIDPTIMMETLTVSYINQLDSSNTYDITLSIAVVVTPLTVSVLLFRLRNKIQLKLILEKIRH